MKEPEDTSLERLPGYKSIIALWSGIYTNTHKHPDLAR